MILQLTSIPQSHNFALSKNTPVCRWGRGGVGNFPFCVLGYHLNEVLMVLPSGVDTGEEVSFLKIYAFQVFPEIAPGDSVWESLIIFNLQLQRYHLFHQAYRLATYFP